MKLVANNRKIAISNFEEVYLASGRVLTTAVHTHYKQLLTRQLSTLEEANRLLVVGSRAYTARAYHLWQAACRDANIFSVVNKINTNLGYIYAVTNPAFDGYFKVGSSFDAETRLNQYQTASPFRDFKLDFYALAFDFREKEKYIHNQYKAQCLNEWVKVERKELKTLIMSLSSPPIS